MSIDEEMKKKIESSITDLELNIEHVKSASMLVKASRAEVVVDSSLVCIKLIAEALGVKNGN